MSSTLRLRCLDGGREYSIEDGLLLGRDPSRDIVLDSSEVSRKHAQIRVSESGASIEDLDSTNGLKIAGRAVPKARLMPGQVVVLGDVSLMVVDDSVDTNATLIGANLPGAADSMVVDEADDGSTTFRSGYAMPPGWSPDDYSAVGDVRADHAADRQMLSDLLQHRGVRPETARAALMTVGESTGSRIHLLSTEFSPEWRIGRGDDNAVLLDHSTVSGLHATLVERGDKWWLTDDGSTNGTELNGQRIRETEVIPGDVITFGKLRTVFDVVQ